MDRLHRLLTGRPGEKGYRVVGDDAQATHQSSMPSKKVGRIAIVTVAILMLGLTAYTFSPSRVTSIDPLRDTLGTPEKKPSKEPVAAEPWEPLGPPKIDWPYSAPPTETTPVPPSESDFYGVQPSETPHVPGPDSHGYYVSEKPGDESFDESEQDAAEPTATGPVPEADLKPQTEEDFYGAGPEETPHVPGPDSEEYHSVEGETWGEPAPEDWLEPTPPEWDEPQQKDHAVEGETWGEPAPDDWLEPTPPEWDETHPGVKEEEDSASTSKSQVSDEDQVMGIDMGMSDKDKEMGIDMGMSDEEPEMGIDMGMSDLPPYIIDEEHMEEPRPTESV